ncbi:phosphotransferase [Actinocatenispora sera]|uniref:Aminoglycoside phosphotransferase domain-containing protein n=1 Tax=Actinocatenispora sera TaxID=390989 RepID=A0A810KUR6_9ACTN|nr:phosphotransferase [Actinocatenispora sera]BCJ26910.1 hypothetical protein Asera_10180 [Actinocatenispora sera]
MQLPDQVILALAGGMAGTLVSRHAESIGAGTGAATGGVARLTGELRTGADVRPFTLIRKRARPAGTGRHAAGARDPRHFAYWRREPLAYASDLLPRGPGLRAPLCYGVVGDTVYLADTTGGPESGGRAARRLAAWQTSTPATDPGWLAGHQLAQRLAVTSLDWADMPVARPLLRCWARRRELLAVVESVPTVLSHGDFHRGNLIAAGADTVVLDWATLGIAPVGADLAHLALSTLDDPVPEYLAAARGRFEPAAVRLGYTVTVLLTGISRLHWMLSGGRDVPPGYERFLLAALDGGAALCGSGWQDLAHG